MLGTELPHFASGRAGRLEDGSVIGSVLPLSPQCIVRAVAWSFVPRVVNDLQTIPVVHERRT